MNFVFLPSGCKVHYPQRLFLAAMLLCLAFFTLYFSPPAYAESGGVRLDSLWGKWVVKSGMIQSMIFSPDNKNLLIADNYSHVTFYNAQNGDELRTIYPKYGCTDMEFSSDGNLLFVASNSGIDVLSTQDYESIDTLPYPSTEFALSPDGKYILTKNLRWGQRNENDYWQLKVYSYPEKQLLWQKEVVRWDNGSKVRYDGGKVAFSADGKYVLAQNQNSLCQWDWRDSNKPEEYLFNDLPNVRLIAFSPDRNYFVLQSNYIYSIREKKLLEIEGLQHDAPEYGYGCSFTKSSQNLILTYNLNPYFLSLTSKQVLYKTSYPFSLHAVFSSDSALVAFQLGSDAVHIHRVNWGVTSVTDDTSNNIDISISPLPSKEQIRIVITSPNVVPSCRVTVSDMRGVILKEIYRGLLDSGKSIFLFDNSSLLSGTYFLSFRAGSSVITQPFIITR